MSELLEKLRKRRDVVDEGGLHFESSPDAGQCTVSARENSGPLGERSTPSGGPSIPSGGSRDFQDAINRRRARVDDGGEAWESKPAEKTADCTADRQNSRANLHASGARGTVGADFHKVIDKQRAVVDGGGLHFESRPTENAADFKSGKPAERRQEIAADSSSAVAQDTAGEQRQEVVAAAEEAMAATAEAAEIAPLPASGGGADEAAVEEAPAALEASEAAVEEAPAALEASEADASSDDDGVDDAAAAAEHCGEAAEAAAAGRKLTPEQVMKTKGNRITWLVELGSPPLPTVFESPTFSIRKYGDVVMKLYPHGIDGASSRCTLVLSGPSPRPAGLQAMLFAGKGWKHYKKNLKPWREGEDMVEHFDIAWASRTMLLCGLVFQR